MSKRYAIAVLVLIGSAALVRSQGQTSANFLQQAFVRVTDSAAGAAKLGNFGYQEGISVLGAWVKHRDSCDFSIPLSKGVNYLFVAGGDNDAQDLDLDILDGAGNKLAGENRVAPETMVTFAPPADGFYVMRLTLQRSRKNFPCVCVACVLKEDGHKVPLKSLDEAAERMMKEFAEADKISQKEGRRLELRKAPNQWALYGAVLAQGQSIKVTNLDMGSSRRVLLALGDKSAEDVDLTLLDRDGKTLIEDAKTNAYAVIGFDPVANARYGIKMLNYKASGPSVVMTGFFDVIQR